MNRINDQVEHILSQKHVCPSWGLTNEQFEEQFKELAQTMMVPALQRITDEITAIIEKRELKRIGRIKPCRYLIIDCIKPKSGDHVSEDHCKLRLGPGCYSCLSYKPAYWWQWRPRIKRQDLLKILVSIAGLIIVAEVAVIEFYAAFRHASGISWPNLVCGFLESYLVFCLLRPRSRWNIINRIFMRRLIIPESREKSKAKNQE